MLPLVSVFCRAPRPGRTKTRLTPPLTPGQAAGLSAAFLLDLLDGLRHPAFAVEACAAGAGDVAALAAIVPAGTPVSVQGEGDLGTRMAGVIAARLRAGRPAAVLTGADCPTLGPAHVLAALAALEEGADVALCPSGDGGYSLIAAARPVPQVFREVPWSGPGTFSTPRARARAARLRLAELAPVDDVDRHENLVRLTAALARPGAPPATRTRRALAALGPAVSQEADGPRNART